MPSSTRAVLERPGGRVAVRLEQQLGAVRVLRRDDGQPAGLAHRDVVLLHEPEHVGVEAQRLLLVVDEDAGDDDLHRESPFVGGRPAGRDLAQRRRVEVVELVPALATGPDQAGRLEHVEVLRDGLPRRPEAVFRCQPDAELEQGLAVAFGQLIEDRPTGGIRQRLEHVSHATMIGKQPLACQFATRSSRLIAFSPAMSQSADGRPHGRTS